MSLWEYKVISSGKGGFATPALLEKFLNDLGRDEWEIIEFRTSPENPLAFSGLARRTTQRDWTLEDAAAAAAKAEAEKLRAEFEAKFKAATSPVAAEERAPSFIEEKVAPDDGFRKPVDTSHDAEPEAEEDDKDDWDKLTAAEEDELPTFFEAIKPHMRRNQRGPGMSVGVDYLAKKWEQTEDDLKGALEECGFVIPEDEDAKAEYLEYDGDLYWINVNRRGELWINMKEKPRPVFRTVKAQKALVEEEPKPQQKQENARKAEPPERKQETTELAEERPAAEKPENGKSEPAAPAAPLPHGPELLAKIRPHMRRNRRGPGGSGSTSFLARALKTTEADLRTAYATLGLTVPTSPNEKPVFTELGNEVWWLNLDSRGGLWINGRDKKPGEVVGAPSAAEADTSAVEPAPLEGATSAAAGSAEVAGAAASEETKPEQVPSSEAQATEAAPADAQANSAPAHVGAPADSSPPETQQPSPETTQADVDETQRQREVAPAPAAAESAAASAESAAAPAATEPARDPNDFLTGVRLLLKETKTGSVAAKVDRLAEELSKPVEEIVALLEGAGLKVPEKPREKPVFVQHAGEILWFNKNAKGEVWLNAKASKFSDPEKDADAGEDGEAEANDADSGEADEGGEKKPRRARTRRKDG